jgi:hypothetical protein
MRPVDRKSILRQLTKVITSAVELKARITKQILNREVTREVHFQQLEDTEKFVADIVAEVIEKQIREMASRLGEIDGNPETKSVDETALVLTSFIISPDKWKKELVDAILPALAVKMAEAGVAQWMQWGVDPRIKENVDET